MNILDKMERLYTEDPTLWNADSDDSGKWWCYYTELGSLTTEALPALIRVARAAERWREAESSFATHWGTELEGQAAEELATAEIGLEEVLQQLRSLETEGGAND